MIKKWNSILKRKNERDIVSMQLALMNWTSIFDKSFRLSSNNYLLLSVLNQFSFITFNIFRGQRALNIWSEPRKIPKIDPKKENEQKYLNERKKKKWQITRRGGYIRKRKGRESSWSIGEMREGKKYKKMKRTKGGQEVKIGEHSRKSPKSISYPLKTQRWSFFFYFSA